MAAPIVPSPPFPFAVLNGRRLLGPGADLRLWQMRSQPNVPTKNAWAFFGLTILEAVLICVLEGVIVYFINLVVSFKESVSARTVLTYLIIYIFASYSLRFRVSG
jgi:hypothetical protein